MARSRRRAQHQEASHERWLITYADLITLLLVFFVVLYSISQADQEKFDRVSGSLQKAFNVEIMAASESSVGSLENDPRFVAYLAVRGQVGAVVQRADLEADAIEVELTHEGIVIHLSETVLFAPGNVTFRPDALRVLDAVAAIIESLPNEVRVEGHTDNVQPEHDLYQDNWELSVNRAVTTVRYLTDINGIQPERLSAVGYGQHRPRADNSSIEGRRQNRRVDFVIMMPELYGNQMPEEN